MKLTDYLLEDLTILLQTLTDGPYLMRIKQSRLNIYGSSLLGIICIELIVINVPPS